MGYARHTWTDFGPPGPAIEDNTLNIMEDGIERAQGDVMKLYGLTANRPASDPLLVGRLYIESDLLQRWWRDNGAGWDQVQP